MSTSLLPSQCAKFTLSAHDAADVARAATFSVKVANYALGYVFNVTGQIYFVPKGVGENSITITGKDSAGNDLPPMSLDFTVTATPPPPEATHFVVGAIQILGINITTPTDPGTDTVTGTL